RQSAMKDRIDEKRGSKARRTWEAASCLVGKGVGTPPPVGFLECWQDKQLGESYYLAEYQHGLVSFKDELIRLFMHDPECEKFMSLLQCVASSVRAMHDAGFIHNDLGNQNILLRRKDDSSWGDVQFVDLNRGRTNKQLSLRERARDISRIYLPSDLLRVFKEMYFAPTVPPSEFQKWEKWYRRLYSIHSGTRWIRHPIRTRKIKKKERGRTDYPSEKDMWIWDERSGQPISIMRPADRSRYYGLERPLQVVKTTIPGLFPVWMQYTALLRNCYQKPVSLKDRIGMAINPKPETADRELTLLKELGTIPVLMRFYSHESEKEWGFLAHIVKTLHGEGHSVSVALVQDRNAVTNPRVWALFVAYVL
ncbi:MAG: lipopolysaccharide kinase InaA family protein, partial [Kiritimatiellae bacterium]|nr:lipopolysaccharide kinase InaA family protein [Kiritimatiellia bacterium]